MSHSIGEYYLVYDETPRRARKSRMCSACKRAIARGEIYMHVGIVDSGRTASSVHRCGACQRTHEHLRALGDGDTWPDEQLSCGLDYEEEWGGEPPDDVVACAFATGAESSALLASRHEAAAAARKKARWLRRWAKGTAAE
jgi:hypothetical protein